MNFKNIMIYIRDSQTFQPVTPKITNIKETGNPVKIHKIICLFTITFIERFKMNLLYKND